MHGQGTFYDPRLNDPVKFPIAARAGFGNVRSNPDLVTAKLPALQFYQLALPAPTAPAGSFDTAAAARGAVVFNGQAKCAVCHVPPIFTEPGWNMHTPEEIGIDDFQAKRSPDERYRTARTFRNAARRDRALQHFPWHKFDRATEIGPGRIPEVALKNHGRKNAQKTQNNPTQPFESFVLLCCAAHSRAGG
jgi:hypothetical protein